MQLTADSVFDEFVSNLREEIKKEQANKVDPNEWGNAEWTKLIKTVFRDIGKKDFKVYSTLDEGEYLLDLVWSMEKGQIYKKLKLGLECEWGSLGRRARKDDVVEDFYKLADVKCDVKVLIYYTNGQDWSKEFKESFEDILRGFELHRAEEEYLFIEFADSEKKVIGYKFKVPNDLIIQRDKVKIIKLKECDYPY